MKKKCVAPPPPRTEEEIRAGRARMYAVFQGHLPMTLKCGWCSEAFVVDSCDDLRGSHHDDLGGVWVYCPFCGRSEIMSVLKGDWENYQEGDEHCLPRYRSYESALIHEWWKRVTRQYKCA